MRPGPLALMAVALLVSLNGCRRQSSLELPPVAFNVEFGANNVPTEMIAGRKVSPVVTFKNASPRSWPSKPNSSGRNAVRLSYHWLDGKGRMIVFDGLRTPLPHDLAPGETVNLTAAIQAPEKPGKYMLDVTLLQEGNAWFPEMNGAKLSVPVRVVAEKAAAANRAAARFDAPEASTSKPERPSTPVKERPIAKAAERQREKATRKER